MHALNYMHYIKCFANWVYRSIPAGIRWFGEPVLYPLSQAGRLAYLTFSVNHKLRGTHQKFIFSRGPVLQMLPSVEKYCSRQMAHFNPSIFRHLNLKDTIKIKWINKKIEEPPSVFDKF